LFRGWLALGGVGGATEAPARHGIVATVHPLATDAALAAMRQGGNAVDAAIAAALTLGVVDGHDSGIGGGCFLVIRLADGGIVAIDGRETAPAAATRNMFVRQGKADAALSQTGALAAGVPGALAAYAHAVAQHGKLPLRAHLNAAARVAEDGFVLNRGYAVRLKESASDLARFPASRAVLLHPDGSPLKAGDRLRQPDLAATYRAIAEHGLDWFYRGPFARAAADWLRQHGGRLRAQDFAAYQVRLRAPLRSTYRDLEIVGFPPPSSGGVHVAQILNMLEHFDVPRLGPGSADFVHVAAEAMKRAFADRAHWLGDPDFAPVPVGLIAKGYAAQLAGQISLHRARAVPGHGEPPGASSHTFERHTTHFSAADASGVWVAGTATINTSFGSKIVVPGTGVLLNNEMDDFSAQPGVTNYFGLIGAEANSVAPGKRPLSSMAPTLVLREGVPILALGAAGGPTIISQVALAIVNVVDFRMDLRAALAQPRFHHQWQPDELRIERRMAPGVRRTLSVRGHKVKTVKSLAAIQAVGLDGSGKGFAGAHDPNVEGKTAGW
jgi:gamma-glutamyltranspeptidase/glutathione hydrolase